MSTIPTNEQRPFVLLDRDGVINRRVFGGQVLEWKQFEFLPRALEGLRLLAENGYSTLVISKQECVGQNLLKVSALEVITRRFLLEVAMAGGEIQQVYYCLHVPADRCKCRPPQPGLIQRAQLDYSFVPSEAYFVGDSFEDLEAAASAGCPSVLVRRDAFLEKRKPGQNALTVACDLYEAAQAIIAKQSGSLPWMPTPSQMELVKKSVRVGH